MGTNLRARHSPELDQVDSWFDEATPELIEARSLQHRTDTKFVVHARLLPEILTALRTDCAAIHNEGQILQDYENLYFDTEDFRCLRDHQRGLRPRFKVRYRHHRSRQLSFLEVKRKGKDESTAKTRLAVDYMDETPNQAHRAFVEAHSTLSAEALHPTIKIRFKRISLLGLSSNERVTVDQGLEFQGAEITRDWTSLAILEVKQERFTPQAPVLKALRESPARALSISKYCLGVHLCLTDANTDWMGKKIHFMRTLTHG